MTDNLNADYLKILDSFHEYLFGIVKLYEDILPVIKDELEAISREDIRSLDENLKIQQALLYRTKNFDNEVAGYTSRLNIDAENLSSLILRLPEDQQLRFYAILGRFAAAIQEVSFYKEKCRVLLQTKLYTIDKALAGSKGIVENKTYGPDASDETAKTSKSFETIV
ncbi:hypothetical protein MASR2M70_19530 [Bacillota bacterium]